MDGTLLAAEDRSGSDCYARDAVTITASPATRAATAFGHEQHLRSWFRMALVRGERSRAAWVRALLIDPIAAVRVPGRTRLHERPGCGVAVTRQEVAGLPRRRHGF